MTDQSMDVMKGRETCKGVKRINDVHQQNGLCLLLFE